MTNVQSSIKYSRLFRLNAVDAYKLIEVQIHTSDQAVEISPRGGGCYHFKEL